MSSQDAQQLLQAMLNKPLYVVLRTPSNTARMQELLEPHLRWAIAAERRGELFASGPFVAEGMPAGMLGGMSIVRASSEGEAREILGGDPFIAQGVFSIEVRRWMLMEGGFSLTVRFSDQSIRLH
jgi:uncharacterized protein YciI